KKQRKNPFNNISVKKQRKISKGVCFALEDVRDRLGGIGASGTVTEDRPAGFISKLSPTPTKIQDDVSTVWDDQRVLHPVTALSHLCLDSLSFFGFEFYKEEEKNDPEFSKKLVSLADLYANDAFGSAHRAHASTEGVAKYLKPSVPGYLMQKTLIHNGSKKLSSFHDIDAELPRFGFSVLLELDYLVGDLVPTSHLLQLLVGQRYVLLKKLRSTGVLGREKFMQEDMKAVEVLAM
ncbi:3-phosphoglycerate kinase, partial [Tanacetum coccineum]